MKPPPPPGPPDASEVQELIDQWAEFTTELEKGYSFDLDNWLNDVDVRELILEALPMFSSDDLGEHVLKLDRADKAFLAATRDFKKCVWGKGTARKEKWTPQKNWWYFRAPVISNAQLEDELATIR